MAFSRCLPLTHENVGIINQCTLTTEGTGSSKGAPTTYVLMSSYEAIVEPCSDSDELLEMEMDLIISLGQSQQFNESSYHSMLINCFGCSSPYATLLTHMAKATRNT